MLIGRKCSRSYRLRRGMHTIFLKCRCARLQPTALSDGTKSYGYDAENRVVSASNGAVLTYDPLGRLWQTADGAFGRTQFVYDGDALAVEYDGDTGAVRRR